MEFIIFLLSCYFIYSHFSIKSRLTKLEDKLNASARHIDAVEEKDNLYGNDYIKPKPIPVYTPEQNKNTSTPLPTYETEPVEIYEDKVTKELLLVTWFREQTLIKIGSIIFFLGAVWFVSYAIEQNWVSPIMRIVLGLMLACAVYATGILRKTFEQTQYQVLTVLGTGIFLGTVIASQFAFTAPVVPASIAFLLMVASVGYTLFVAYETKSEWLAILASISGLCAPLLINPEDPSPVLLLVYLFVLSTSLLGVVFITSWRSVSLTLLLGTSLHLAILNSSSALSDNLFWFFVVLFSTQFCVGTTISVFRTNKPVVLDIITLAITTLQFIIYAISVALIPELALFIAAAITASIGYILRTRGANADAVSLYIAISLICSIVGTTLLFDGFVLTIAYSFEALAIYLLSIKLATLKRTVVTAATLFSLPMVSGYISLYSYSWNYGILNKELLGVVSVLLSISIAIVWSLRSQTLQAINWLRFTAGTLFVGWYIFAISASSTIANSQQTLDSEFVRTVLFLLVSFSVITYILRFVPRTSWKIGALFTLIAPILVAIDLLTNNAWSEGIKHQPFWGAMIFFFGIVLTTVIYWVDAKRNPGEQPLIVYSYSLVWLVLGYGMLFLNTIWDSLLTGDLNRVATSVSFTILVYLIANCLMLAGSSAIRISAILSALIIPGILLIESLKFQGWEEGAMSIDAVGLYVTTTILFLLGTSLRNYKKSLPVEEQGLLQTVSSAIYIISGLIIFSLVWMVSQSTFASDAIAVTVALFVYTVAGLVSYSYGRVSKVNSWRHAGILMLGAVVLRLGLVDFWGMEPVWKIVTFLGIGLLFIVTALLERSQDNKNDSGEIPQ